MPTVLAGAERPVRGEAADGDEDGIQHQVGVRASRSAARSPGPGQPARPPSRSHRQAVAVLAPDPAASSANVPPLRRWAKTSSVYLMVERPEGCMLDAGKG